MHALLYIFWPPHKSKLKYRELHIAFFNHTSDSSVNSEIYFLESNRILLRPKGEDSGMHTTVDDNPLRADNPSTLPYFPLFPSLKLQFLRWLIQALTEFRSWLKTSTAAPEFSDYVLYI